jgi:glycosyltransferase involved in cell wall biosynthesis
MHRSPRRLIHHTIEAREFSEKARLEPKPDLIFSTLPTLALGKAAAEFGVGIGRPVILDINDCWPDHYLVFLPPSLRPLARPLLTYQYTSLRRTLQLATGVTAVSKAYLQWAYDRGKNPSPANDAVFPIGYDWPQNAGQHNFSTRLAQSGLAPNDFIVLFIGTFATSFDLKTVLDCAELLDRQGSRRIKFALVGAGPYESSIRSRASSLSNVTLIGWIQDQQELRDVLTSATVGLCPYREGGSISLPNKPFEFMAAGKPLLSSLTGELWDIIEQEEIGLNYRSSSAESLLNAIIHLAGNPEKTRQMSARSKALYETRYKAEKIYPAFAAHLEKVHQMNTASARLTKPQPFKVASG